MTTFSDSSSEQWRPVLQRDSEPLGQSEAFLDFQARLSRVAPVDRPVLLLGERGTGKELAAARLHYLSPRWQGPFVAVNCAALAPGVIESELFGHEAGAFTNAQGRREGRFKTAHGGTLFLDEIGQIPMGVQEKILRAVEYKVFERVGGSKPIEVDVRIVSATNADLPALANEGRFKRDLLDRLAFEVLHLPPLRTRHGDIELLARHFATRMAQELQRQNTPEFSRKAFAELRRHRWPGNIRELKNVVERSVSRTETKVIETIDFDPFQSPYSGLPTTNPKPKATDESPAAGPITDGGLPDNFGEAVAAFESSLVRQALDETRFNQREAAERLGLSYHQFRGLYRKYKHTD